MSLNPHLEPEHARVSGLANAIRRLDDSRRWMSPRLDQHAACSELLAILVEATAASRASLLLTNLHTGRLRIMAAFGLPADIVGRDLEHAHRRISDWVLRERKPLLLNGEVNDQRFQGSAPEEVESALCLPLVGPQGAIGVVNLARVSADSPFGPVDLATTEHLTKALTTALEQVREHHAAEWSWLRLRAAGQTVRRIAPGLFQTRGYQIALAQLPSPLMAGDLCERVAHADGSHTVMVADVTGSGAEALAAGALAQGLFLAFSRSSRSPAEIAGLMNVELAQRLGRGSSVRLWLAYLSANGQVVSCNAGFPAPFVVPMESDDVRSFDVGGPLLGVLPEAAFEEQTLRLLPGDAVVAVSDGVLGARSEGGLAFGMGRAEEIAVEQRRQPLDRMAEAIARAALDHQAATLPVDDLTVFALRYSRDI